MDNIVPGTRFSLIQIVEIALDSLKTARYSITAAYTLQVYDWLLLLDTEVELIHQGRWTSIKVAYLVCRYYPLLAFPVYMWAWLGEHTLEMCRGIVHPLGIFIVPFQLSAQAVILMRTYAFTGRNKYILCVLCMCYASLFSAEMWLFGSRFVAVSELYLLVGKSGCFLNDIKAESGSIFQYTNATHSGLVLMGAFLFDLFMISMVGLHHRLHSAQGSLAKLFVAQGLLAFVVMSTLNLLTAIAYLTPYRQYDGIGLPFVMVIHDVMACRLILTLRRKAQPTETYEMRYLSHIVQEGLQRLRDKDPSEQLAW